VPLVSEAMPRRDEARQQEPGFSAVTRELWYALTVLCLFAVFAADFFTPLGFAHGTLHMPVVLLAALSRDRRFVLWSAGGAMALTVAGALLSPQPHGGISMVDVVANRVLSILAIGISAGLAVRVLRHIEELRNSREALAESGQSLRHQLLLVQAANRVAHLGSWAASVPDLEITWSDETCRIYGVAPGTRPTLEEAIERYLPEAQARLWAAFEACVRDGTPFDEEAQLSTLGGRPIWVRAIGQAVRGPDGAIVRVEGALQDLSLEKHEEAFAYQSRRWFRDLADAMPQIVWTAAPDGVLDYSSRAFYDYIGSLGEGEPPHVRWRLAVHPDDRDAARESWMRSVAAETPYRVEYRLRRADGAWRWHLSRGQPIRDETGAVIKWYGTTTDVDETTRLQQEASRVADRLATTLDSMGDGFFSLDREWRMRFVNRHAERLMQRPREELVGSVLWGIWPDLAGTRVETAFRQALAQGRAVEFEEQVAVSGRWFEVRVYPGEDGLAVYFHDVTRRREAQAQSRLLEERFANVARAIADAIWDWELASDTVWWSEGMERLFGHASGEDSGGGRPWPDHVHPDDRERVLDGLRRLAEGQGSHWQAEYRFLRRDGSVARVAHRGFVIRDEQGRALRIVGGMTDITERIALEERLRESQRLESMGQLTGGVAHDFNNLLTVILGNAELLGEELAGNARLSGLSEMISGAAQRGAELTQRLLAFARRQALEPQVIDVNRLVSGMQGLLHRTLGEDIEVVLEPGDGLWRALVDPSQLEGALLNLCINARDAMPAGGRLSIGTSNVRIDQAFVARHADVEPGRYVEVRVSDTGAGIAPQDLPRVFEPFFSTKGKDKGSGLGLSMVYGFVKQSRGHVSIESQPGQGTVVKMYLPRADSELVEAPSVEPVPARTGAETVLLVEDDELVRCYGQEQLAGMGYRVLVAGNGMQALEVLHGAEPVDLLFTDVVMPGGMSGRELAEEATRLRPGLKVLYTSGYAENAIVHDGRLDPGVQLLRKPYRRAELARKVRVALDE
jgi:PAS domain S-box-containing protein